MVMLRFYVDAFVVGDLIFKDNSCVYTSLTSLNSVKYVEVLDCLFIHVSIVDVAVGCPDMVAPANAWIERSEERMTVRCNYSLETWYLTCKGNDWIGTFTNCTDGDDSFIHSFIHLLFAAETMKQWTEQIHRQNTGTATQQRDRSICHSKH